MNLSSFVIKLSAALSVNEISVVPGLFCSVQNKSRSLTYFTSAALRFELKVVDLRHTALQDEGEERLATTEMQMGNTCICVW